MTTGGRQNESRLYPGFEARELVSERRVLAVGGSASGPGGRSVGAFCISAKCADRQFGARSISFEACTVCSWQGLHDQFVGVVDHLAQRLVFDRPV
jgi:hypothetical protein